MHLGCDICMLSLICIATLRWPARRSIHDLQVLNLLPCPLNLRVTWALLNISSTHVGHSYLGKDKGYVFDFV